MNGDLPAPIVNPDSAPYWEGARNDKLLLQRCGDCGTLRFFPRYLCTECGSEKVDWIVKTACTVSMVAIVASSLLKSTGSEIGLPVAPLT